MIKLDRIYTRGGDRGETSLGDGTRVAKHDLRVEAYGTVDEVNAVIGVARFYATASMDSLLMRIQNDLFDLGADLCTPLAPDNSEKPRLRIEDSQVTRLESEIDASMENLAPLASFVLPAGTILAAHLHLARTVVRRAERCLSALQQVEAINAVALRYLNRLSDLLFVLARIANENGKQDVLWVPGAHR
ncbi:MAG: cob(I)yrinic acid a,c-diamide adenosyltransferase [Alphaproteobacteria bacterium]